MWALRSTCGLIDQTPLSDFLRLKEHKGRPKPLDFGHVPWYPKVYVTLILGGRGKIVPESTVLQSDLDHFLTTKWNIVLDRNAIIEYFPESTNTEMFVTVCLFPCFLTCYCWLFTVYCSL